MCVDCGSCTDGRQVTPGSFVIEVGLWLFGLLPVVCDYSHRPPTPEGIGPRRKLCVAYAYNSNPAHADHGRSWPRGHGLVWKSFSSGVPEFSIQGDENWRSCGLDEAENKVTSHVHAVFTIPLRRPAESEKEKVSSKVTAVLSFDALTQQAAQTLKQQYEQFLENKNKKLLQRAAWISLYF